MAFTNPILAGDELMRNSIQSDNYNSGAEGWRLSRDGSMQLKEIAVRDTLWCDDFLYKGQQLSSYFDEKPAGVVGYISGYYDVSTTSEAAVGWLEVWVAQGRIYNIIGCTNTHNPSTTNMEFKCRFVTNNTTWPTNSSAEMSTTYPPIQQWQQQFINAIYRATYTGPLRLRFSVRSLNPPNTVQAQSLDPGSMFAVMDLGTASDPGPGAIGVTQPGGKVQKEWTITANSSKTYLGTDGSWRTDPVYINAMIMGDFSNGRGNQRGWCTFSNSDISTYLNDLVGVPETDIQIAEVRLRPEEYKGSPSVNEGYISLGYHGTANSLPGSFELGGGIPNVTRYYVIGTNPYWLGIKTGGPTPSYFMDNLRSGSLKGFMVGNTFSGSQYCCVVDGAGLTYPPQLHMKYLK